MQNTMNENKITEQMNGETMLEQVKLTETALEAEGMPAEQADPAAEAGLMVEPDLKQAQRKRQ